MDAVTVVVNGQNKKLDTAEDGEMVSLLSIHNRDILIFI